MKSFHVLHPGAMVAQLLKELKSSPQAFSRRSGLPLDVVTQLLNGTAPVTPEIAAGITQALGSTPEFWLRAQERYDMRQLADVDLNDQQKIDHLLVRIDPLMRDLADR